MSTLANIYTELINLGSRFDDLIFAEQVDVASIVLDNEIVTFAKQPKTSSFCSIIFKHRRNVRISNTI